MIIKTEQLWKNDKKTDYVAYLMDNSTDIEPNRKHSAMIICGGGGFMRITDREKEPVALYFLNQGFQSFVLNYTTDSSDSGVYPSPVFDLAKLVLTIREHAKEWNVDSDKVCVIGFSAGGTICASLATQWHESFLSEKLSTSNEFLKPNAVILCYPLLDFHYQSQKIAEDENKDQLLKLVGMKKKDFLDMAMQAASGKHPSEDYLMRISPINHISPATPPIFIWGTADDNMIYVGQLIKFVEKLNDNKIPYEFHMFESGNHGSSLGNYNTVENGELLNFDIAIWTELAISFLTRHLNTAVVHPPTL
ncbi:alpha/beta hydrolase [Sporolactobacillus shoreicorticis]|uniref:Alpha/beta hydrolase n=1 Tax=Sporolactobacillus shoreicorticis TaxID=1923877 RepID=A0ABW5S0Q6_9BACL|nr:alpha/beta hydrolase [Sporolactobacillus shoreicorticis]MCO7125234.1 alpha/beta hydrolase [Sporolactobacillus shoreicorticis]